MKGMMALGAMVWLCVSGCGGDAHLELAAADALHVVADELDVSLNEYHAELARLDDVRETEVIHAFVARVRRDHADEATMAGHEKAFVQAMQRIREDRATAWRRHQVSAENVGTVREVATGLQKLALQSLSLEEEMRRYLESWIELRRSRKETVVAGAAP